MCLCIPHTAHELAFPASLRFDELFVLAAQAVAFRNSHGAVSPGAPRRKRQSVRSEGDLTSCDVQREMCLRFANARGLRVSGERFDDEGISGATIDRPALQRL